jgi:hypothetical protein
VFTGAPPVHKRNIPAERQLHTRFHIQQVCAGFSGSVQASVLTVNFNAASSETENGAHYRDALLSEQLRPAIYHIASYFYTFQHDSAPVHHVCETNRTPNILTLDL